VKYSIAISIPLLLMCLGLKQQEAFLEINREYLRTIKPVFSKQCLDCHSDHGHLPGYYRIPGVKWLIDRDIGEARKTIDMSNDFPFIGKATPGELLGQSAMCSRMAQCRRGGIESCIEILH